MFNNVLFVLKQEYTYQLNPPHSLSIHSTLAIFILSTRPLISAVDIFPQKKNPGIQATHIRLSEYPETLYSKPFFTIYFCTFDIKHTVSTWLGSPTSNLFKTHCTREWWNTYFRLKMGMLNRLECCVGLSLV